jgi:hypothetical protein
VKSRIAVLLFEDCPLLKDASHPESLVMLTLIVLDGLVAGSHSARLLRAENLARVHNTVRVKRLFDSFH